MSSKQADKNPHSASGAVKSIFKQGLRRTLFLWFMALSLIPMMIVSIFSYLNAYESLKQNAENSLRSVSKMKTAYIYASFDRMLVDLRLQSELLPNVQFIENLGNSYKKSGKSLSDFIKSFRYTAIVEEHGADLKKYRRTYGYHDIFLIDRQGDMLFSITGEDDLGTNLFNGKYAKTLFAGACKQAFKTGLPAFSDFEFYAPSSNAVAGFLVSVIVNQDGDKIGLMAFQISIDQIDPIMQESAGLGKTAETYLVGTDLKMRSNSVLAEKKTILRKPIDTELTRLWQKEHAENEGQPWKMQETVLIYTGPHGKQVLGIHTNIRIAGVPFAVIAEIEKTEAFAPVKRLKIVVIILMTATGVLVLLIAAPISRRIVRPIMELSKSAERVAAGQFDEQIRVQAKNEIGELAQSFDNMLLNLRQMTAENEKHNWLTTGQAELNDRMRGEQEIATLGRNIITFLAEYLKAQIGALYLNGNDNHLRLVGSYAFKKRKNLSNEFELGDGLVGQAALKKESIILTNVPEDYISVSSGLGQAVPRNILVMPFVRDEEVMGVVELGTFHEFSDLNLNFLNQVSESIAIAVQSAQSRRQVQKLLEKSRAQAEELQVQQEELRQANEELEEQTELLRASEARLREQQEELQQTNEELEEQTAELESKTKILEAQKRDINNKNAELEAAGKALEEKAEDLEMTGKFKSEFLANMSHELRTPLNSILLLSRLLATNKDANLTEKQVEFAQTVHESGTDLLNLINEVLDLSKVEAGKIDLNLEDVALRDIADIMERYFKPIAQEKGLGLNIDLTNGLPEFIRTDRQRVEQIVKNLLSNAFKFTSRGDVVLRIYRPDARTDLSAGGLNPEKAIEISVADTGIGIPKDQQKLIFQAFQQADGATNRKYGGTGLGLSISKELAKLLGGELRLESNAGTGSTFILSLPDTHAGGMRMADGGTKTTTEFKPENKTLNATETGDEQPGAGKEPQVSTKEKDFVPDDRTEISPEDKSILIIEDDSKFAKIMRDLAREKGFKALVAKDGETALHFADYYKPSGIILDIGLPGMDGWTVMSRLKNYRDTRHIPVHFVSASDKNFDAMKMGAVGYLTKPASMENLNEVFHKIENIISKPMKNLLVVEDDKNQRKAIVELIGNGDVRVTAAATGHEAYTHLNSANFDCMILDLGLPDMSGVELLNKVRNNENLTHLPIIVYTGKDLTKAEEMTIDKYAEKIIIKGVKSPERLLDETALFLHRVETNLPEEKQKILRLMHDKESILNGKKILLVDDDMRNVYALKNILEAKGINVLVGKNGKEGLECMSHNPDVDLILMDIMMPEMDGYEAMREIRKQEKFKKLPIIALTAKAMKGDRAKCIQAGSNDYLAKPVNVDKLLSMLRVWLY